MASNQDTPASSLRRRSAANTQLLNILNQPSSQQNQHMQSQSDHSEDKDTSFFKEISDIMRGFGDAENQSSQSIILVEKIVQQQLHDILHEATDIAIEHRGSPCPSQSDFEFLMRHHPVRLKRMQKYLKDMIILRKFYKARDPTQLDQLYSEGETETTTDKSEGNTNEKSNAKDKSTADPTDIDSSGSESELDEQFDEERMRRLIRANRISLLLSGVKYQEFAEARRTSFYQRHSEVLKQKFRTFLQVSPEIQMKGNIYDILSYLAHETIAVIVDFAILTRLNSENREQGVYNRVVGAGVSSELIHAFPEVTQSRGEDGLRPITRYEIYEGLRRFHQLNAKGIGFGRNISNKDVRKRYLAI